MFLEQNQQGRVISLTSVLYECYKSQIWNVLQQREWAVKIRVCVHLQILSPHTAISAPGPLYDIFMCLAVVESC